MAETTGGTATGITEIWWVDLRFAAVRHETAPFGAILTSTPFLSRVSTDTLQCCFSAAVCVQVVTGAFGPAQKLPPAATEVASKTGSCARAWFVCAGVCQRFRRVLAHAGVRALIFACLLLLCACRCCAARSTRLRSCHQQRPRRQRRGLRACVQWLCVRSRAIAFKRC